MGKGEEIRHLSFCPPVEIESMEKKQRDAGRALSSPLPSPQCERSQEGAVCQKAVTWAAHQGWKEDSYDSENKKHRGATGGVRSVDFPS